MRKTLTLAFVAALLVGAAVVYAQPWDHHRGMGMQANVDRLATALNLNDTQKAAVQQLHDGLKTQAQPLFEQARQQMQEIHTLLDSGSADATELGQKMLAAHATHQKIKALHDDFAAKVSALLDPDQLTKFKALQSMRQQFEGKHGFGAMAPPPGE